MYKQDDFLYLSLIPAIAKKGANLYSKSRNVPDEQALSLIMRWLKAFS
jgi:hypothetical protein